MIEDIKHTLATYIKQNAWTQEPQSLYEPMNYIMRMGGKRIRPLLVLLGCKVFQDNWQMALPAALAVEVFHNFSLVHDDIMDRATARRGQPTVHQKYGLNAGILSGDVMLVKAFQLLEKLEVHSRTKVTAAFTEMAIRVCEGQQYDTDFETQTEVSKSEYLHMISGKTASLIATSLKIGALCAAAQPKDVKLMRSFGQNMGMAFQIMDDWLDAYGIAEKTGKRVGGDIVQNKKTYLYTTAWENAGSAQRQMLTTLFTDTSIEDQEKINEVMKIFNNTGVSESALQAAADYEQHAVTALEQVDAPVQRKQPLFDLSRSLLHRNN